MRKNSVIKNLLNSYREISLLYREKLQYIKTCRVILQFLEVKKNVSSYILQ